MDMDIFYSTMGKLVMEVKALKDERKDGPNYCHYVMKNETDKSLKVIWTGDIEDEPKIIILEPEQESEGIKSTDMGWGGRDTEFRYHIYKINQDGSELDCGSHRIKIELDALSSGNTSFLDILVKTEGPSAVAVTAEGIIGGESRTPYAVHLKSVCLSEWIK
jgi:hypothetical protein